MEEGQSSYTLPEEDPKNILLTWHAPCILLTSGFFHRKSANFIISRNIDIDCILIHNFCFFIFFYFFYFFEDFFNKSCYNFHDFSKNGYHRLLKITVFWNNVYDIVIPFDDVTNKIQNHQHVIKLYFKCLLVTKVW